MGTDSPARRADRLAAAVALAAGGALAALTLVAGARVAGPSWLALAAAAWLPAVYHRVRRDPEGTRAALGDRRRLALAVVLAGGGIAAGASGPRGWIVSLPALALLSGWVLAPAASAVRERLGTAPRLGRWVPVLVLAGGALLVFVQSFRRHAWFGSTGKDLGLFHQTHWLLSRSSPPENTVMGMNAFADHLELIDLVAAPLQWVWPSPSALLLVQSVAVAGGAAAVAALARRRLGSDTAALALGASFLLAIDVQNAVMFDWNPTTCAAGLVPWAVWGYERGRAGPFAAALAGIAAAKENLVLYAAALCVALALGSLSRRRPDAVRLRPRHALLAAGVLLLFFAVEMTLVVPLFRPEGFRHLRYEQLGASGAEIAATVVTEPVRAARLLFSPAEKLDGIAAPFAGTAFLALLAPHYLVAMGPAILERYWSTHVPRWWGYHYGAALAAIALLAALSGITRLTERLAPRLRVAAGRQLALAVLVATVLTSVAIPGRSAAPLLRPRQGYWGDPVGRSEAEAAVRSIPPGAAVAAQNHLIPHLSARHEIYELTRPVRADYVALHLGQGAWPFTEQYPRALAQDLRAAGYGVHFCSGRAIVLARGAPERPCAALGAPPG